jgi:hypothetical protein
MKSYRSFLRSWAIQSRISPKPNSCPSAPRILISSPFTSSHGLANKQIPCYRSTSGSITLPSLSRRSSTPPSGSRRSSLTTFPPPTRASRRWRRRSSRSSTGKPSCGCRPRCKKSSKTPLSWSRRSRCSGTSGPTLVYWRRSSGSCSNSRRSSSRKERLLHNRLRSAEARPSRS